jgi:Outer membrane protein beta-barrel domain
MRKYVVLPGLLLLLAGSAMAQVDTPKVETSPAYMYIRINPGNGAPSFNCQGAGGNIAYNLNSWFGIAADLGGCKVTGLPAGVSANAFTYGFGPRISFRSESRLIPFLQVTFGGTRLSGSITGGGSGSQNAFAFGAGGGFDIRLSHRFALRPVQAEYYMTNFGNTHQNNFRLKSGIVIRWGER